MYARVTVVHVRSM